MKGSNTSSSYWKFRIIGGPGPLEYAERGWGQFDVEVVIGKPGKYVFQGKPDTCSKNFYLSGQFKCDGKKLKALGDITYEKINPNTITIDELNYFMHEIEPGPKERLELNKVFDALPMPVEEF